MSTRTWDIVVVKVISRKRGWQIQWRSCTPAAGCAIRDKMVYWYCSSYLVTNNFIIEVTLFLLEC